MHLMRLDTIIVAFLCVLQFDVLSFLMVICSNFYYIPTFLSYICTIFFIEIAVEVKVPTPSHVMRFVIRGMHMYASGKKLLPHPIIFMVVKCYGVSMAATKLGNFGHP